METQTWRIDLNGHKRWEEGEGGTNGESSTETYTVPYVKYIIRKLRVTFQSFPYLSIAYIQQ